ncbi:hypothetical protein CMK11_19615 [Candidatus Poribacteria bacterium]|nr:hypothetical protein [Candidatus Poribacteria bacterium]
MNQPRPVSASAPAGISLERLVGAGRSHDHVDTSARTKKPSPAPSGDARMQAELHAVRDERDHLRDRMEALERRLEDVAAAQNTRDEEAHERLAGIEATVTRLAEAFLPDEACHAHAIPAQDLTNAERVRRWIVGLFRDDEEYYVN